MTYDEITLFRRFLTDKGTLNNFEYFYANHRFKPVSIDAYYEKVDAEDAILEAFDMGAAGNSIFSFQYWKKLDEKWQRKLGEFRDPGKMEAEVKVLCPHCGRTLPRSSFAIGPKRYHVYCKECESGEWDRKRKELEKAEKEQDRLAKQAKQLEKEIGEKRAKLERLTGELPPLQVAPLEKVSKVCPHCGKRKLRSEFNPSDTSEDGLQSLCKRCQDEMATISDYITEQMATEVTEPATITQARKKMEDFTFFDFESKGTSFGIAPHTFAINRKKGNYTVVMSKSDSKTIIENNLLRLRLRQDNITGDLHFVFNATTGAKCVVKNKHNVTVANRELVEFLTKALGYEENGERVIADISEDIANTKEYVTFLIKRPKK